MSFYYRQFATLMLEVMGMMEVEARQAAASSNKQETQGCRPVQGARCGWQRRRDQADCAAPSVTPEFPYHLPTGSAQDQDF
jgi:hypothetical protein